MNLIECSILGVVGGCGYENELFGRIRKYVSNLLIHFKVFNEHLLIEGQVFFSALWIQR